MVKRFNPKKARRDARVEWVGGRFFTREFVRGSDGGYRPELVIWVDPRRDEIIHQVISDPQHGMVAVADALQWALEEHAGPRPTRVRVAHRDDAAEIRARFGAGLEVVCAATPEIEDVAEYLRAHEQEFDEAAWFDELPPGTPEVPEMFHAARELHELAPWKLLRNDSWLRVDVPDLGVEGACLAVLGSDGEYHAVVLYPSYQAFLSFMDAVAHAQSRGERCEDCGSSWFALEFEDKDSVPPQWLRSLSRHGLPLLGLKAFPLPEFKRRDGSPAPISIETLRILTPIALALTKFVAEQKSAIANGTPLALEFEHPGQPRVRICLPYEAGASEDAAPAARPTTDDVHVVSRTAPGERSPAHEIDEQLSPALLAFAAATYPMELKALFAKVFDEQEALAEFVTPVALYCAEFEGRPVYEHFLEQESERLSPPELRWLKAQRESWLSIWEVTHVNAGEGLSLRDLLSGERREVVERMASRSLSPRQVVLGRVAQYDGDSVLCGLYPRALDPVQGDAALKAARRKLRLKEDELVGLAKLRGAKPSLALVSIWRKAVAADDALRAVPPMLQNTEGDPLLLTVDHYRFDAKRRREVVDGLLSIDGLVADDADAGVFVILSGKAAVGPGSLMVGRVEVRDAALRVETNSLRRADMFRSAVEAALGPLVTHRLREHSDPVSQFGKPSSAVQRSSEPTPPEVAQMLKEFMAAHIKAWVDEPVPALGNKTPRAAMKTKTGRAEVDLLLRQMETLEARGPAEMRGQVEGMRRELGLI